MATKGFESVASFSKWLPRQPLIHNPGSRCLPVCDVTAIRLCCAQKSYQYMIIASLALQEKKILSLTRPAAALCSLHVFLRRESFIFSTGQSQISDCVLCYLLHCVFRKAKALTVSVEEDSSLKPHAAQPPTVDKRWRQLSVGRVVNDGVHLAE